MKVITFQRGRIMRVSDTEGEVIARVLDLEHPPRFTAIRGQKMFVADITGVLELEVYQDMQHEAKGDWKCEFGQWHGQFESCGHTAVRPVAAVEEAEPLNVTPWKAEQFAALRSFFAQNMRRPVEDRLPHRAWIETEAEFRAVMAGEAEWPELDPDRRRVEVKTYFRWIRKVVTEKAYHALYQGQPVIEKYGTEVAVGVKRIVNSLGLLPDGRMLEPGESWAKAGEVALLEGRFVGRN